MQGWAAVTKTAPATPQHPSAHDHPTTRMQRESRRSRRTHRPPRAARTKCALIDTGTTSITPAPCDRLVGRLLPVVIAHSLPPLTGQVLIASKISFTASCDYAWRTPSVQSADQFLSTLTASCDYASQYSPHHSAATSRRDKPSPLLPIVVAHSKTSFRSRHTIWRSTDSTTASCGYA